MAAIFQIRRGTINTTLTEGELYLHQGSGSLQFGSGSNTYNTLTLNAPVKGDINLIGNISASGDVRIGGNIYLGDSVATDNISALGVFTTNLVPNGTIDLGTTSAKWNNVYANNISGAVAATNGVISGSSQIISILISLNTFSGSQLTQNTALATISGSLISTASVNTISVTNLNTFSGSQLTQNTALATISSSLILTTSNHEQRLGQIESKSGSYDTRFNSLATISGSLISTASANVISIATLNLYSSSLKTAIELTGSSITILGNLVVKGTQTTIDSTTIQLGDNIIELNGSSNTNGGLLVKDPTSPNTLSGSLLWDSTNDYWKAGGLGAESKILLAGGDSVVSGSSQILGGTGIVSGSSQLASAFEAIANSTHTIVSGSSQILGGTTIHSGSYFNGISVVSGSSQIIGILSNLNSYTSSLNSYTASANAWSGTIDTRFTTLGTYTASVNQTTSSLNTSISNINYFTASMTASYLTLSASVAYLNGGVDFNAIFLGIQQVTSSLHSYTSSANIRFSNIEAATSSYETKGRGIVSGSSQILGGSGVWSGSAQLPPGVISGSSQVLGGSGVVSGSYETTGRGIWSGSAQLPPGVISGSSQVLGGSGVVSGSYETTGRSIVSSSAQIIPLLPSGVVSGSTQVITNNSITLGTHTVGSYIQTIAGTTNQITVAGSGLESADVTLSLPQNIHTSATPTFAGLTINGAITATGDITAYYSDKRLKDISGNIDSALDKVNQISGVYYKQNELAETFGYTNYNQQVGVIAQEIQSVLPEAIALAPFDRDENGNSKSGENYLTVHYEKIIPLLIQSIKELSAKVKELENK